MANDFDSDAMLAFFGQLGKEIDAFKVKLTGLNEAGAAMKKMTDETERFGQTIHRHTTVSLRSMETSIVRIAGGAAGLATSIVGAAIALDRFAAGELKLRNFATNTGFSVDGIKGMRVQLAAAGVEAGEAAQGIGSIGAKLQEVLALQETSSFYRSLQASEPAMAEYVRHLVNAGKMEEARNYLQERFNQGGERFKSWLPTVTGVSRAAWEAQRHGMEGLIQPWKFQEEEAAKYHKNMVNLSTIFGGVWTSMSYTVLEGINKMIGGDQGFNKLNAKAKEFTDNFKKFFDENVIPTLKTTMQEVKAIIRAIEGVQAYFAAREEANVPLEGSAAGQVWDWLKGLLGGEDDSIPKGARPRSFSPESVIDTEKEENKALKDMRDIMVKWDDGQSGFAGGGGVGGGGGGGGGGGDGASPESSQGGPAGLSDEGGKPIDAETMRQAEILGRAGDVAGLQKLFAQKGYRMSGPACGRVATGYVKSAGFKPPSGAAIATSWHNWGEKASAEDVNKEGRPFGSMVGTYWHRRYGGNPNEVLRPGQTGGHVMTPVPGTYDPKTKTIMMVDQYGMRRRNIGDIDFRYAGDTAVAAVRGDRSKIDTSLKTQNNPGGWNANLSVNFKNVPEGVKTSAEMGEGFKTLQMNRNNQLAYN